MGLSFIFKVVLVEDPMSFFHYNSSICNWSNFLNHTSSILINVIPTTRKKRYTLFRGNKARIIRSL